MSASLTEIFGEPISIYTRAQALEDGVLVDVSEAAREAGFKYPVAITAAVHGLCTPPKSNKSATYSGRLWDVLMMLRFALKRGGSRVFYQVKIGKKLERLKAECHPGDNGEPVITIMEAHED